MAPVSFFDRISYRIKVGLITLLAFLALALVASNQAAPDSQNLFSLKRLQEKTFMSLKLTPTDRLDYTSSLLGTRLEEIERLVRDGKTWFLWSASLRYGATAGQAVDLIKNYSLKDKIGPVQNQFREHQRVLRALDKMVPRNQDHEDWKFIQDDINYLEAYLRELEEIK